MVKFNILLVTTMLFLMSLLTPEASCKVLPREKQNMVKNLLRSLQVQAQVLKPNPRTTGDISPLLRQQLHRGPVARSAPNPGTNNPALIRSHNVAPLPGSLQKSPLPPFMPNGDTSIP
uniref:Uncharacterized protein n=1 Tax=Fagus sylvatica TaxID=28930 RepID=A0A2N9HT15_FAGSY